MSAPSLSRLSSRSILLDYSPVQESFLDAVIKGLSQSSKSIPCRFLYDEEGSKIFDDCCETLEYYLTRAECEILFEKSADIAEVIGSKAALIEFGPGSSLKARLVLKHLIEPVAYVPIDVSRQHLIQLAEEIASEYPDLEVKALCADYTQTLALPPLRTKRRVGFFPGSTLGNLKKEESLQFLIQWAEELGEDGAMIIGVDLKKTPDIVIPAYTSPVATAFTVNILHRANRELGTNFVVNNFELNVQYDEETGHVGIYLESKKNQNVTVAERTFNFEQGELLHIEDSHKYSIEQFLSLAKEAGYKSEAVFIDSKQLFSVHVLRVPVRG